MSKGCIVDLYLHGVAPLYSAIGKTLVMYMYFLRHTAIVSVANDSYQVSALTDVVDLQYM